jgi:FAS-associated factor 2
VRLLHTNDILVWGGDVRDREAYSASLKLQATTYPFVAFVALQPKRTPRSANSSSTPTLTVLSRHQGPPSGPTSPAALAAHLETQLLPRVTPFLAQLRATQHAAAADRALREDQDRAFRETAARDGARIEALMQADARAKRDAEDARVAAEIEQARAASEKDERERRARAREGWRRWTRKALADVPEDKDGVRLAIRLPDGGRVVRRFADGCSLTALYAFVDAQLVGDSQEGERSPNGHLGSQLERAMEEQIAEAGGPDPWWGFQLVLAYPRREIPWASGSTVGDVESLKGGAQLVVHLLQETVAEAEADDDGYVSEE